MTAHWPSQADPVARGDIAALRVLQKTPIEVLTRYFEVNFEAVAEELARAVEPYSGAAGPSVAGRAEAGAHVRELIRALMAARADAGSDSDAPVAIVTKLAGLSEA